MKSIGYILPTNLSHEGILLKVQGQLIALEKRLNPKLCFINYKNSDTFVLKLFAYLIFELKAFFFLMFYPLIYIRYNPKSILLNLLSILFSWIKPIYIEHNTLYSPELRFLKRKKELFLHHLTYTLFRLSRCIHVGVNQELCDHLNDQSLTRVVYAQNGYHNPSIDPDIQENSVIKKVNEFKKKFKYIAIFCGNGYAWHGLADVVKEIEATKDIGLIVVGPFDTPTHNKILPISFLESATLTTIIELCDFSISTFRWDLINISQGSPLKSRQYLCHGCPMIVNYYDSAMDFKELRPYIIDFRKHKDDSFSLITALNYSKQDLKKEASTLLSWDTYFNTLFST